MPKKLPKSIQVEQEQLQNLLENNQGLNAIYQLNEFLHEILDFEEMTKKITNLIPQKLGFEFGALTLLDKEKKNLVQVAESEESGITSLSLKPKILSKEVIIPLKETENVCVKSLRSREQYVEKDLYQIYRPSISREEAEKSQKKIGMRTSVITPLFARKKPIGVFIVGMSKEEEKLTNVELEIIKKFSNSVGIAIENSRLFTDLKRTKEDLTDAYKKLKAMDELKDEFLSVAAHELRTPITVIMGYLWMLENEKAGKLNKRQKGFLEVAIENSERMTALVNDMLNVSKIERGNMKLHLKKMDICKKVKDMCSEMRFNADQQGIYLTVTGCDEGIDVLADDDRLSEILSNLLDNAIKFTKKGGVTVSLKDTQDYTKISIKDTGVGISKEDIKHLFHKFGRLETSYIRVAESGGTGLGLYIVKLYVEKMNGRVGAESPGVGKGSTFWFTLPKKRKKCTTISNSPENI